MQIYEENTSRWQQQRCEKASLGEGSIEMVVEVKNVVDGQKTSDLKRKDKAR